MNEKQYIDVNFRNIKAFYVYLLVHFRSLHMFWPDRIYNMSTVYKQ